jgi:hypothetical protein
VGREEGGWGDTASGTGGRRWDSTRGSPWVERINTLSILFLIGPTRTKPWAK